MIDNTLDIKTTEMLTIKINGFMLFEERDLYLSPEFLNLDWFNEYGNTKKEIEKKLINAPVIHGDDVIFVYELILHLRGVAMNKIMTGILSGLIQPEKTYTAWPSDTIISNYQMKIGSRSMFDAYKFLMDL